MANIKRQTSTRYYLTHGKKRGKGAPKPKEWERVTPGTPGAVKVTEKSECWYLYDGGRCVKKLSEDKDSATVELANYIKAKARGESGLTEPYADRKALRPLTLSEEYLKTVDDAPGNDKYKKEGRRILTAILRSVAPDRLDQLTGPAIMTYLSAMSAAPTTKRKHHSTLNRFCTWLFKRELVEVHPMVRVDVPKGGVSEANRSRPLSVKQVRRLIRVATRRPLEEALTVRRGKDKGKQVKKLGERAVERYRRMGTERALVYRTACTTGLRRSELGKLEVRFLRRLSRTGPDGKKLSILDLPGAVTKNGQPVRLLILPRLARRLRAWFGLTGRTGTDRMFRVPSPATFRADRGAAGIPADTPNGKAVLHSLRKSANRMLREAGVPVNKRRLFMRHSDIRLTDITYDDASLLDLVDILPHLEAAGIA